MNTTWTITTGTDNSDGQTVGNPLATEVAAIVFLQLAEYAALTVGIQDAWLDGCDATLHLADDRWIILSAGEFVPEDEVAELDVVMEAIAPFIDKHMS